MEGRTLARVGAIAFVAVAVAAAAVEMTRHEQAPISRPVQQARPSQTDPLRLELARCQLLGEPAARDPACLRAWATSRARFLGGDRSVEGR